MIRRCHDPLDLENEKRRYRRNAIPPLLIQIAQIILLLFPNFNAFWTLRYAWDPHQHWYPLDHRDTYLNSWFSQHQRSLFY
jgi:hypothetical protein